MSVRREVHVEGSAEQVWTALSTAEGREEWLEEPDREIEVEHAEEPRRLVWRWSHADEPVTRVEFVLVECISGTRVLVTESSPAFPIEMLAASFALVPA
jgi:uncharacterized protein YndB with AHSA1/START domain